MIKFAITLSQEGQSEEGQKGVAEFLAEHDITLSAKGLSTLSCVTSEEVFRQVFAQPAEDNLTPSRTPDTVGASAPFSDLDISLPEPIRHYVDHISVTPPIRRF